MLQLPSLPVPSVPAFYPLPPSSRRLPCLYYRSNSNGTGALQCFERTHARGEPADRYVYFMLILPGLVYECTFKPKKIPSCCTGNIPKELGRCSAMKELHLYNNQLTGEHFFAQFDRSVYEHTAILKRPSFCAGTIPTELGLCTAMYDLNLDNNQLTGKNLFAHMAQLVYE